MNSNKIAVLIPCYNEEQGITSVINDVKKYIPEVQIYVYDNNSTDNTFEVASAHKDVIVRKEHKQGKGHVVRRMFSDIDADIYIMIDGDMAHDVASAPQLLSYLQKNQLDMVIGSRVPTHDGVHRPGHALGGKLLTLFLRFIFGGSFSDNFAGFRVFSRRFVKSFPTISKGFEIETEMSIHALELDLPVAEIETPFHERAEGSVSKLNTFRDGFKILKKMLVLCSDVRPLFFFGTLFLIHVIAGFSLGIPVITEFLRTSLVPRFPTAILSASIVSLGFLWLFTGIILNSLARHRKEMKRLFYLQQKIMGDD